MSVNWRKFALLASGVVLLAIVSVRGPLFAGGPAKSESPEPMASLPNAVMNVADSTEHDTQSTTAIVRGSGSTVIAAFTNSAVNNGSNHHMTGRSRSLSGFFWSDLGALPASASGDGGSPVLARDTTSGRAYLSTMAYTGFSAVQIFQSTDDGASWPTVVNALPGFGGGDSLQHPWVTVDNFPGTGQGNVYEVARNVAGGGGGSQPSGVYFSKSTDNGATFTVLAGSLSAVGTGPSVVVGTDHSVYVFWWINLSPAVIRFVKSTDRGATFGPIITAATLTGTGSNGDLGLGGGFATNSFPNVAVNPAMGDVYVAYNDKNGSDKGDIFLVGSSDGGTTWSSPTLINNDGPYLTNKDQFTPAMAFTPDGKRQIITWYDRRRDAGNSRIERWGVMATMGTFNHLDRNPGPNFNISTGDWPVVIGQDSFVAPTYMGDYDAIAADNGSFWSAWGDNRLSGPAHLNQPDARVARVPVNGPSVFDIDRDWETDWTIFRPSSGVWYSAASENDSQLIGWGQSGDIDVMADYDGDEKADVAIFRPSTGLWYIVQSSNNQVRLEQWGVSGDIPLAKDITGDGKAEIVVWRPSNGTWFILISGGGTAAFGWGTNGDIPILGDYHYELNPDLVAYRPSTGVWYVLTITSQGTVPSTFGWGTVGDIPVSGDWDGDRLTDYAVFRPSTGTWLISKSTGGTITVGWGLSGDTPVSGDWDNDGKSDYTIWRDSTGVWFTQYAIGGGKAVSWGISGDKPTGRVAGS